MKIDQKACNGDTAADGDHIVYDMAGLGNHIEYANRYSKDTIERQRNVGGSSREDQLIHKH